MITDNKTKINDTVLVRLGASHTMTQTTENTVLTSISSATVAAIKAYYASNSEFLTYISRHGTALQRASATIFLQVGGSL